MATHITKTFLLTVHTNKTRLITWRINKMRPFISTRSKCFLIFCVVELTSWMLHYKFNEHNKKNLWKIADECGITNKEDLIPPIINKKNSITTGINKTHLIITHINKTHLITAGINNTHLITSRINKMSQLISARSYAFFNAARRKSCIMNVAFQF